MGKQKSADWLTEQGLACIRGLARDGLNNQEIAKAMGINPSTLYEWKKAHPEIAEALKNGKMRADYVVVESLYQKCIGYYTTEQKAFKCKDTHWDESGRRCESERVEIAEVRTYIAPDTTAIAIWLNNRLPDKFKRNHNKENLDQKRLELEEKKTERDNF